MTDISFTLTGLNELAQQLQHLPDKLAGKILDRAVGAGARLIRDEVKARAPVDTGALRSQIFCKREHHDSAFESIYVVGVRNGVAHYANNVRNRRMNRAGQTYNNAGATYYWRFLEFGTRKMAAHPFLRPAFDAKNNEAVKVITETLDQQLPQALTP